MRHNISAIINELNKTKAALQKAQESNSRLKSLIGNSQSDHHDANDDQNQMASNNAKPFNENSHIEKQPITNHNTAIKNRHLNNSINENHHNAYIQRAYSRQTKPREFKFVPNSNFDYGERWKTWIQRFNSWKVELDFDNLPDAIKIKILMDTAGKGVKALLNKNLQENSTYTAVEGLLMKFFVPLPQIKEKNKIHDTFRLPVALSSHRMCFICGRKQTNKSKIKLHRINSESLGYFYSEEDRFIVKSHARACGYHLTETHHIKREHILIFDHHLSAKAIFRNVPRESIIALDAVKKHISNSGPFDKFKNMDSVDDNHCEKITGWNKNVFMQFLEYLTDLKTTDTRTKEELVAIYRFWLRNGISQTCIALYKKDNSQQTISNYLDVVRLSVEKYFVPFFLGASRGRDFFLNHRTEASKILYDLNENDLCFVADGTYAKHKKSKNHEFQYNSYSSHKKCNLMKIFLICCPDGYIVDCYGPFFGKDNDATIFNYILNKDDSYNSLVRDSETHFVLDRGNIKFFFLSRNN